MGLQKSLMLPQLLVLLVDAMMTGDRATSKDESTWGSSGIRVNLRDERIDPRGHNPIYARLPVPGCRDAVSLGNAGQSAG